jgi:hypothetical protein
VLGLGWQGGAAVSVASLVRGGWLCKMYICIGFAGEKLDWGIMPVALMHIYQMDRFTTAHSSPRMAA